MRRALFVLGMIALLGACEQEDQPPAPVERVSDVWVRLPAVDGRPGAAYFTLNGGEAGDTLIAVESARVATIEMHESMEQDGRMTMTPIRAVDAPAGGSVRFEPGGRHAMLFGIDPSVTPGSRVALDFRFDSGRDVRVEAPVVAAGDPRPRRPTH